MYWSVLDPLSLQSSKTLSRTPASSQDFNIWTSIILAVYFWLEHLLTAVDCSNQNSLAMMLTASFSSEVVCRNEQKNVKNVIFFCGTGWINFLINQPSTFLSHCFILDPAPISVHSSSFQTIIPLFIHLLPLSRGFPLCLSTLAPSEIFHQFCIFSISSVPPLCLNPPFLLALSILP